MTDSNSVIPSRASPQTLVPGARALYEQGLTRSQVLKTIYGVDLPLEVTLFLREFLNNDDDEKPIQASWGILPWELMRPLEVGGPRFEVSAGELARVTRIFAQAPHVLLLGTTGYDEVRHGASLIGYDLNELLVGRTTIVGLPLILDTPESNSTFNVFGPSLISVFRSLITRYRALMDKWSESGQFGVGNDEVLEFDSQLASIEALQREIDESRRR
jgi:hypothetical protein